MLTLFLINLSGAGIQTFPAQADQTCGSCRNKGLEIYFYRNSTEAFAALKSGEVDLLQCYVTYEQYQYVVSDPTLMLAGICESGLFEFDLNNNYTIADFPGVRNPLNEVTFRRALAHMVDKDWIISEVLKGFGQRIDAPVDAAHAAYANESVVGNNYPYPYSLTKAAELLDICFKDTDGDGTRNYPVGWPGRETGPNLDPIKVCIRNDHQPRLKAGRALADNMRVLGVPVNQIEASSDTLFPMVMSCLNYHIYTGGWSPAGPPTYLYPLYHSDFGLGLGSNYITGMNSSNMPNYPDLDAVLEDVYFATSLENFAVAVKKATGLIVAKYCINIPLWSNKDFMAYRRNLVGVVNEDWTGLENRYTFLNAYKADDPNTPEDESQEPIKMGTVHEPKMLNILFSSWYYDYAVLDRVFTSLTEIEPYNLAVNNPWVAQDWETSTWYDPQDGENKTKVTYWIRKDVFWHAPVTGEAVRQFTAHDVEFTMWYAYKWVEDVPRSIWGALYGIHHTKVVDDFTIEVYFDYQSIWAPPGFGNNVPLLPKDEYLNLLCTPSTSSFYSDGTNITTSTKFIFTDKQVVQVISGNIDGTPLVEGIDFEILATGSPHYTHNEIHFLTNLPEGTVTINYYTQTVDPHGYYLAKYDWTKTFYSIGPYYPASITPGEGGFAIFKPAPSFFLETPPLGEIDWKWTWTGTTKPRGGYYQVSLYDAVKVLQAYGAQGIGIPDTNWFPGADIDLYDLGHVGLYDAVTVISKYGTKWGIVN
jgi:ABC-type transport system substrate-binding protein